MEHKYLNLVGKGYYKRMMNDKDIKEYHDLDKLKVAVSILFLQDSRLPIQGSRARDYLLNTQARISDGNCTGYISL